MQRELVSSVYKFVETGNVSKAFFIASTVFHCLIFDGRILSKNSNMKLLPDRLQAFSSRIYQIHMIFKILRTSIGVFQNDYIM